jgi:hypothetical protein
MPGHNLDCQLLSVLLSFFFLSNINKPLLSKNLRVVFDGFKGGVVVERHDGVNCERCRRISGGKARMNVSWLNLCLELPVYAESRFRTVFSSRVSLEVFHIPFHAFSVELIVESVQ